MKNQQDNASNDKYFLGINDGVVNTVYLPTANI